MPNCKKKTRYSKSKSEAKLKPTRLESNHPNGHVTLQNGRNRMQRNKQERHKAVNGSHRSHSEANVSHTFMNDNRGYINSENHRNNYNAFSHQTPIHSRNRAQSRSRMITQADLDLDSDDINLPNTDQSNDHHSARCQ